MLLTRLLWYYTNSVEFSSHKHLFFDVFNYFGECGDAARRFHYHSTFYRDMAALEEQNSERYGRHMTKKRIRTYFSTIEDDHQLFATVFSCMLGLSDGQIAQIADPQQQARSWDILDFFLRDPTAERFDTAAPQKALTYYVELNGALEEAALVENTRLRLLRTGELLEILP